MELSVIGVEDTMYGEPCDDEPKASLERATAIAANTHMTRASARSARREPPDENRPSPQTTHSKTR